MQVNSQVAACCGFPSEGMDWAMDCGDPNFDIDDLHDSSPFPITDLLLRDACIKVIDGELLRKVMLIDSEMSKNRMQLSGRQVLWLIFQDFKVSEATGALYSFRDLNNIHMKQEDISGFMANWDYLLLNLQPGSRPTDRILLDLFYTQIKNHSYMKQFITQTWDMMDETDPNKTYHVLRDRVIKILNHRISLKSVFPLDVLFQVFYYILNPRLF